MLKFQELQSLFQAAELHGTLQSCVFALKNRGIAAPIVAHAEEKVCASFKERTARTVQLMAVRLNLMRHADKVLRTLEDKSLPNLLIKGKTFGERLYPSASLRGFTDIDLLVPVASRDAIGNVLIDHGFSRHDRDVDEFEDKWIINQGAHKILIEVHCDLVHSTRLRPFASLQYEDVLEAGNGNGTDATALLLVAATHGAVGHQFNRLQQLIDVLLCARGAAGEISTPRLRNVAARCGLMLPLLAALDLAGRTFSEPCCAELAKALAPPLFDRAACRLLSSRLVICARGSDRAALCWRRRAFRAALILSAWRFRKLTA